MKKETDNQLYLRRAKAALDSARSTENDLRRALAEAVKLTSRAKEKYENLFLAEEVSVRRANLSR